MGFDFILGLIRKFLKVLGWYKEPEINKHENFAVRSFQAPPDLPQIPIYQPPPYRLRDNFLSPAEFSFFKVLESVVVDKAFLCIKVSLNDIFWVQSNDPSEFRTYTNKIDRKHVDFLLCKPITLQPILGIELDDKSHLRQNRQERDAFVDEVFKTAGLPLLHIPVRHGYQIGELSALLTPYLEVNPDSTSQPIVHVAIGEVQFCPKCGGEMVLRRAKRGTNAGNQFWGCSNYPKCRTMIAFEK